VHDTTAIPDMPRRAAHFSHSLSLQPTPLPGPQDRRYFVKRFPVLVMRLSQGRG